MEQNPFQFLRAATPYVRQFRHKYFVVKLGGDLLADADARRHACDQLSLLHQFSIKLVVVHGGGPQLDELCRRLDVPTEKVAGRRVTTAAALDAAKMLFAGSMQVDLLAEMRALGLPCVGLSGVDAGLIAAQRRPPVAVTDDAGVTRTVDYGFVGDIEAIDPRIITHLADGGFVPVIAPLSADSKMQVFNTNADTVAAEIAGALKAEKLFFMLRAPGVLADPDDPSTLISYLTRDELQGLAAEGRIRGGMRPKSEAIAHALDAGVHSVHLIGGFKPDALLREIFTNEGCGTMVVSREVD